MNNQILFLSALLLPAGNGPAEDITLKAKDASVSGPGIIQTDVLGYWDNGTAEWTLQFDQPIEQMSLMLEYAAPYKPNRAKARAVIPGFFDKKFKIETTDGWNSFTYLKIGSVSLPAGTHALSISYQGPADIMKLKRVLFTPQPEKYTVPSEFPPLFVQEENWAETMTALRAAFRDANMPVTPIDRYLNKADGKALWAAFPRESDWFLQDNQVHGQWGRGFYDARQDYKHYLDPERDSTLEQK